MGASSSWTRGLFTSTAPSPKTRLVHETCKRSGHARGSLALEQGRDVGPGHEHEVVPDGDIRIQRPKGLSQRALHRIPLYRAADLPAHRDTQPGVVLAVGALASRERVQNQKPVGM